MVYICNVNTTPKQKKVKSCHCDNMDRPWGYYVKWNKSDRERQMPYDFSHMWNIKNKQTKNKWTKQNETKTNL